jgi:hypothetical protein
MYQKWPLAQKYAMLTSSSQGGGLMMQHSRLYQSTLLIIAALLCFTFAGLTLSAQAAEGKAKVDRLVMGLIFQA